MPGVPPDVLRSLSLALRNRPLVGYPDQICASVAVELCDHADDELLDQISEVFDLYEWGIEVSVSLPDDDVAFRWCRGSHDDAPLVDNFPRADLSIRIAPHTRVRTAGWLRSLDRREPVSLYWEQELFPGESSVPLSAAVVADPPRFEHAAGPVTSTASPTRTLGNSPPIERVVACLPDLGLIADARAQDGRRRYRLHTADATTELDAVHAMLDALPGQPLAPTVIGGEAGRLAIHLPRPAGLLLIELPSQQLLSHVEDIAEAPGFFDAGGHHYVCTIGGGAVCLDVRTGRTVTRWPDAPALASRWTSVRAQLQGTTLSGCGASHDAFICEDGVPTRRITSPIRARRNANAFHPACGVIACLCHDAEWPHRSLLCFSPSWGMRQVVLPAGAHGPLAVLADGRVLVAGDRLLVVDPQRGEIVDLGPSGHCGERLLLTERGGETWLWTLDPLHWARRI